MGYWKVLPSRSEPGSLQTLLRHHAPPILHMQKALLQLNIQLSQVLSEVTGGTGQAIIRTIVGGERNPHKLAELRNYRCKKDEEATAHLIVRVVYRMLKYQVEYEPLSVQEYEKHYRQQQIKYLERKAARLGSQLSPVFSVS